MDVRALRFIVIGLLIAACTAEAASVDVYGKLPQYEDVALSPDGVRVAYVTALGNERNIVIQNLTDPTDVVRLRSGEHKLRQLQWAGPAHLMITISQAATYLFGSPDEASDIQVFDLRKREAFVPMLLIPDSWGVLRASPTVRTIGGKTYIFIEGYSREPASSHALPTLFRFDVETRRAIVVDIGNNKPNNAVRWFLDAAGKPIVQTNYDQLTRRWSLQVMRAGKWIEAQTELASIDYPFVVGLAPENDNVVMQRLEGNHAVWRRLSFTDGSWGEDMSDEQVGNGFLSDPLTHKMIATIRDDARRSYIFFAAEDQRQWDQIIQSFPNEDVHFVSWTSDRKKIMVRVFGPATGNGYVLVDLTKKQTTFLGNSYAGIAVADVARVVPIHYAAADGLQIGGYLTVPNGRAPKALPLVVLPHGGPAARDILDFDWWAQALASRGYAVLQANFRGSHGYGVAFEQSGYGEWGRKMQTDLSDGVRYLAAKGIIDPKRVCVVGASYGGYAALAGATLDIGVYRCAVSVSGVADLRKFMQWTNDKWSLKDNTSGRYLSRYLGIAGENDPTVDQISPVAHAGKIDIPVLLIHGSDDSVVPFEQSALMASALKRAGKRYELIKLKGEDHWLSRTDTRQQMLQSTVKFLEAHNPPMLSAQ